MLHISTSERMTSKTDLKNTKERARSLEVNLREAEAGAKELKELLKGTIDSEYAIS
jgi:hypothetical protein